MRHKKTNASSIVFTFLLLGFITTAGNAATLTVDDGANNFRPIARNVPASGSVWNSLAQSFTALDSNVLFGFRLKDTSLGLDPLPSLGSSVIYKLYEGENVFTNLLASRTVQFAVTPSVDGRFSFDVGFLIADFTGISLSIGQSYTAEITLPFSELPEAGESSSIGVWTSLSNPYDGGRFYFRAGEGGSNSFFTQQDMLFRVGPIPEPNTMILMIGTACLGLASSWRRRV